jgi:uncharacterized glyoxalase superfamily protein PhnB
MAITPYLLYRDAGAAVDWLVEAFGLRATRDIFKGADGRVSHATLMSLDGYVAGPNGEYDWIEADPRASARYFKAVYA